MDEKGQPEVMQRMAKKRWIEILINTQDLISVKEAAEALGIARVTVYKRISRGELLSCRLGGSLYVLKSEIERILKEKRNKYCDPAIREVTNGS